MQMFVGYKVTKYNMILLQSETIVKVTGVVSLPTLESERERERGVHMPHIISDGSKV